MGIGGSVHCGRFLLLKLCNYMILLTIAQFSCKLIKNLEFNFESY